MVWFLLVAFNKLLIKIIIMHAIYNPNGYGIFVIFMYTNNIRIEQSRRIFYFPSASKVSKIYTIYNNIPYQQCFIRCPIYFLHERRILYLSSSGNVIVSKEIFCRHQNLCLCRHIRFVLSLRNVY